MPSGADRTPIAPSRGRCSIPVRKLNERVMSKVLRELPPAAKGGNTRRACLRGTAALVAAGWSAAGAGASAFGAAPARGRSAVEIGVAAELTGRLASCGRASRRAARRAAREIEAAGGIAGRPLRLRFEDTASDRSRLGVAVQVLLEDHRVEAVLGGFLARLELTAVPGSVYDAGPSVAQRCDPAMPWLLERGARRFALVAASGTETRRLHHRVRALLAPRGAVVVAERFADDAAAAVAAVAPLLAQRPDCIVCSLSPPLLPAFVGALRRGGYTRAHGTLFCTFLDEAAGGSAGLSAMFEGVVSCQDHFAALAPPGSPWAMIEATSPTAGNGGTALHRNLHLYAAALEATAAAPGDDAALAAALASVRLPAAVGGPAEMRAATGRCALPMYLGEVVAGRVVVRRHAGTVEPEGCRSA